MGAITTALSLLPKPWLPPPQKKRLNESVKPTQKAIPNFIAELLVVLIRDHNRVWYQWKSQLSLLSLSQGEFVIIHGHLVITDLELENVENMTFI